MYNIILTKISCGRHHIQMVGNLCGDLCEKHNQPSVAVGKTLDQN